MFNIQYSNKKVFSQFKPKIYAVSTYIWEWIKYERFTGRGYAYTGFTFLVLAFAIHHQSNHLLLFVSLLLAQIIIAYILARSNLRRLNLKAGQINNCFAKEKNTLNWIFHNAGKKNTLSVLVTERFRGKNCQYFCEPGFLHLLPPKEKINLETNTIFENRGEFKRLTPLSQTTFPFGLFKKVAMRLKKVGVIFVYPKRGQLTENFWQKIENATSKKAMYSTFIPSDEIEGVREYRPGDPLKNIHWKASAKSDKWYTKQYSANAPSHNLIIAADIFPRGNNDIYNQHLENVLSFLTTIITDEKVKKQNIRILLPGKHKALLPSEEILKNLAMYDFSNDYFDDFINTCQREPKPYESTLLISPEKDEISKTIERTLKGGLVMTPEEDKYFLLNNL